MASTDNGETMIYSPDHKFLMLKNFKVGGTSLEVELSKVLPDNAIVTKITPANTEHNPRNDKEFYHHMSYSSVSSILDLSNTKSYIFVRNPYDTVLSMFFYELKKKNIDWGSLDKTERDDILEKYFYKNIEDFSMIKSTKYMYCVKNEIMVDKILRYELGIEDEINSVLFTHNIKNITMNTFEKQYRDKIYTVENTFKPKHIKKIQSEWSWEFNMFGYDK
jgi:hypothetical protein